MIAILLSVLVGCDYGLTLPSGEAPAGKAEAGATAPIRLRKNILPGQVTGPPPPDAGITQAQCNDLQDGGAMIDDCVTAEIHCNETIVGHTRGGANGLFSNRFYEKHFCTPATTDHKSGDERVYRFRTTAPWQRALVYLDTPCANLDLAAVFHNGDTCPTLENSINRCEMNIKQGNRRESVDLFNDNEGSTWYIIVEGQGNEEGAFSLTVQCEQWKDAEIPVEH